MTCVMIADAPSPLLTATIQFGGARLSPRVSCNLAVITVSYSNLYEIFVLEYVLSDCLLRASFCILTNHYETSSLFGDQRYPTPSSKYRSRLRKEYISHKSRI